MAKNTVTNKNRYGFWITYNLVDALPMSDEAHRLYGHYIAISNNCDLTSEELDNCLSVRGLAERLRWRTAKVIKARRELLAFKLVEVVTHGRGRTDETIIVDLAERNAVYMRTRTDSQIDTPPDPSLWEPEARKPKALSVSENDNATGELGEGSVSGFDNATVSENDNATNGGNHGINREEPKEPSLRENGANAPPAEKATVTPFEDSEQAPPQSDEIKSNHPAIALVRSLMRGYPNKITWPEIVTALGNTPDKHRASRCYAEWCGRGSNPRSIKPFTEWYCTGIPTQRKPGSYQQPEQQSRIGKGMDF